MQAQAGASLSAGNCSFRSMIAVFSACAFIAAGLIASVSAQAADYPTKPVRIFVPYGPGGVGDLTMRLLADKLSRNLKQQFMIENRPGAGGIVAMTDGARAGPTAIRLVRWATAQRSARSLFQNSSLTTC